jgi:hypothetical protein
MWVRSRRRRAVFVFAVPPLLVACELVFPTVVSGPAEGLEAGAKDALAGSADGSTDGGSTVYPKGFLRAHAMDASVRL